MLRNKRRLVLIVGICEDNYVLVVLKGYKFAGRCITLEYDDHDLIDFSYKLMREGKV